MQNPETADLIIVTEEEAGGRLDKILAQRFKEVRSRTYFQYLIDRQCVLLNGVPVKKRIQPKAGDEIEIEFLLTPELDLKPEPIPLDIVFEDQDLLIVNKPPGMVVHPAVGHWHGTFVNALLYHCNEQFLNLKKPSEEDPSTLRPGIVHRLDKDTSGLLIAAKSAAAQQKLVQMFASKEIRKEYLAICIGNPGNVDISAPIGRHPVHRKLMTVREDGGKDALTLCRTVAYDGSLSLVEIVLATGRTHQIRVHLAHIGHPVLGDATYGNKTVNRKFGLNRQMLHAWRLHFKHPMTGLDISIEAPWPEDMQKMTSSLLKKS